MATKKTKEAPAAAAPANDKMAAVRAARESASQNDRFHFAKALDKGAPQAKTIVTILEKAGKKGLTRTELLAEMAKPGMVVTRQPMSRILGYYQKDLVAVGAITVEKANVPEPAAAAA